VDNQANDPSDTGDNRHYGDNGISVTDPNPNFSFLLNFYFLAGSQANVGASYLDRLQHPLGVASQLRVLRQGQPVFLPAILAR
jgi:hypothetical protein